MNNKLKTFFVLVSAIVISATSCLQENADPNEGADRLPGGVASVQEQVAGMQASVADLESLQSALAEMSEFPESGKISAGLDACVEAVEEHIAAVEAGMDAVEASLKAMSLQREIAVVTAELKVRTTALGSSLETLEEGVSAWLGDNFVNYYAALAEEAKLNVLLSMAEAQELNVDAIVSDVEAGLRAEDASGILTELSASVEKNIQAVEELRARFAELNAELEEGYAQALQNSSSESKSNMKKLSSKASSMLKAASASVSDLMSKVTECEDQIADLSDRLAKVEADIEELVGMIQSLTFVSEYTSESAIAYYALSSNLDAERGDEGKKARVADANFKLSYLVRPASAAAALTESSLWNKGVTVKGYEAPKFQLMAAGYDLKNLVIESIAADSNTGLVTVTVKNAFTDDFYFKEVGAKVALSVVNGKTDVTSKFVEVLPKDKSGKVYAESLTLTPTTLSIQNGDSYQLSAVVSPSNVTDSGCVWEDYGSDVVDVNTGGRLTATKVGTSVVKVTANSTDEWGRELTAECDVEVTPAIRINGLGYVEKGNTLTLTIESPNTIFASDVKWSVLLNGSEDAAARYVTVTKDEETGNGIIKGIDAHFNTETKEYHKFEVKCTVGVSNPVVLTHDLRVVHVQPKGVQLKNGLPNDAEEVTVRIGDEYSLAGTLLPTSVDNSLFRLMYESNAEYIVSAGLGNSTGTVKAVGLGTAVASIKVLSDGAYNYYYPKGREEFKRNLNIKVIPYYVSSLLLSEGGTVIPANGTIALEANSTTTLVPVYTSDVEGHQPTSPSLVWKSSNANVVAVDANGNLSIAADAAGKSAVITATTSGNDAVKPGEQQKSVSVTINVNAAGYDVEVGYYLYSNGEFAPTVNAFADHSIIGVVISTENPRSTDTKLPEGCTHGLVMALGEGSGTWWSGYGDSDPYNLYKYYLNFNDNNYVDPTGFYYSWGYYIDKNGKSSYGYNNTLLFSAWMKKTGKTSQIMDKLSEYRTNNSTPADMSEWYLPSVHELYLISECYKNNSLNTLLGNAGGTQLSDELYWTVSEVDNNWNSCAAAINPQTGALGANTTALSKTGKSYKVRYILAF